MHYSTPALSSSNQLVFVLNFACFGEMPSAPATIYLNFCWGGLCTTFVHSLRLVVIGTVAAINNSNHSPTDANNSCRP